MLAVVVGLGLGVVKTVNARARRAAWEAAGRKCPRCGGSSFTGRRSKAAKVGMGVASMATPKTRMTCDACGYEVPIR